MKLELLTDIDMLMFVERGIRGGISQCCNRYAKANNVYMGEQYKPDEDDKFLIYFDVNNLYGWAMTEPLPSGGFKWVDKIGQHDFFNVPDDHPYGFILEVDLEYPDTIHDDHKDLPFCAEHRAPPGSKQKKLLTTLHNKERYILHHRALKQALENGLILRKVHRALQFNQSRWLKKYIDLNSEKRKNAKNEFEKMLFKLFNNAVYGKTMENERKHVDVKLVNKWTGRYGAEALIAKPNFHSCTIFEENLVAVQMLRSEIFIRKPIYVGLSVLDLSKTLVYRFHYQYMRSRVNCKLLYTDTDSLVYEVTNADIYNIMRDDIQEFDTSDYSADNPFNMPRVNKKIVGLMKDECNGEIMLEFAGLRSKMYSIRVQNQKPIKKAKGVKTSIVKNSITFDDYIKCLDENVIIRREQHNIRSRRHVLHTEREMKVALCARDDKRHLLSGQTDTLPWGHYRVGEVEDDVRVGEPQGALEQYTPPSDMMLGELFLLEDDVGVGEPQQALEPPPPLSALYEQQLQSQELIPQQQPNSDQSLKQQAVKRVGISLNDYDVQSKKLKT